MLAQEVYSAFGFAFIIGLGFLSNFFLHRLAVTPLTVSNEVSKVYVFIDISVLKIFNLNRLICYQESNNGQFIAERAYRNLRTLNDFGNLAFSKAAN